VYAGKGRKNINEEVEGRPRLAALVDTDDGSQGRPAREFRLRGLEAVKDDPLPLAAGKVCFGG
jgi:hypothetical protein